MNFQAQNRPRRSQGDQAALYQRDLVKNLEEIEDFKPILKAKQEELKSMEEGNKVIAQLELELEASRTNHIATI